MYKVGDEVFVFDGSNWGDGRTRIPIGIYKIKRANIDSADITISCTIQYGRIHQINGGGTWGICNFRFCFPSKLISILYGQKYE